MTSAITPGSTHLRARPAHALVAMLAVALIGLGPAPAMAQDDDPVALVEQTTDELFQRLDANRDAWSEDPEGLRETVRDLLLPHLDTVYSGRLVLGRAGRELEREQIEEFAEALAQLLIQKYADALLEFQQRDQMEVLPLAGDNTERQTRVRTRIRLDSGSRIPVDYVFRKHQGEWKIFDVIAEGISYVATFRNQIGEQIRREGFDTVLAKLKDNQVEVDFDEQ